MATRRTAQVGEKNNKRFYISLVSLTVVVIGGAVLLGRSDRGEINVSATIMNSNNERSQETGNQDSFVKPIPEEFLSMPNGGLVPQDPSPEPPPPQETPSEPASDGQASTTEGGEGAPGEATPTDTTGESSQTANDEVPSEENNGTE